MNCKMGVVGLGVMGASLARNIESKGLPVAGYDLDAAKTRAFIEGPARGKNIIVVDRPERLMDALERPRRILMMVPAGPDRAKPGRRWRTFFARSPRRRKTASRASITWGRAAPGTT